MQNNTRKKFAASSNEYNASLSEKCPNTEWFSGPYFAAVGINTERCRVSFLFQFKCGKIRTRKTPYLDTFHAAHLKTAESSNFGHAIHFGKQINAAFM